MQKISRIDQATEGSFLSLGNDGAPDPTAPTWAPMEVFAGVVSHEGHGPQLAPLDLARAGAEELPPDYIAHVDSAGALFERMTGTITLRGIVRGVGDGSIYADYQALPLGRLLDTCMRRSATPAAATDAVAVAGPDGNSFNATTPALFAVGDTIACRVDGVIEMVEVVNVTGAEIEVNPAFSRALTDSDVINLTQTWYSPKTGEFGTFNSSMAFRYRTDRGHTWAAFGCRAENIQWSIVEGEMVYEATVRSPWVLRIPTVALSRAPFRNGSMLPAVPLGSPFAISDAALSTGTQGTGLGRTRLRARKDWTVTYSATMSEIEDQNNGAGVAEYDMSAFQVRLAATVYTEAFLSSMVRNREKRTVVVGCGPDVTGCGLAFVLPGAFLTEETLETFDEDKPMNPLSLGVGFDELNAAASGAGQSGFRVSMLLG